MFGMLVHVVVSGCEVKGGRMMKKKKKERESCSRASFAEVEHQRRAG